MKEPRKLFSSGPLSSFIEGKWSELAQLVDSMSDEDLLIKNLDELTDHLAIQYEIEPLNLLRAADQIEAEPPRDEYVEFQYHHRRGNRAYPPGNYKVLVTRVRVQCSGCTELLFLSARKWTHTVPSAEVDGSWLTYEFDQHHPDPNEIKTKLSAELNRVEEHIRYQAEELNAYNSGLRARIKNALHARQSRILEGQKLVNSLGFKLRKREDPSTLEAPLVRRKLGTMRPVNDQSTTVRNWTLDEATFLEIVSVMRHMSLALERSPSTFCTMGEEDIRMIFVVALNGIYEGAATGETFNGEGKTDILIRHEGKNVFVAECKFWRGEDSLLGAIDQILSYTTWRDTKAIILLFNRNKRFTDVIHKIIGTAERHAHHDSTLSNIDETTFRFRFKHPSDIQRIVDLVLLCFDVPKQ